MYTPSSLPPGSSVFRRTRYPRLVLALRPAVQPARRGNKRLREEYEHNERKDAEEDDDATEAVPIQLRELLEVADHDLACELRLAFCANAKRERHLGDRVARDVALDQEIQRDLEPVRVQVARLQELCARIGWR